jgi:hypothetical protein
VTPDWTLRVVFPPALRRVIPTYQTVIQEEFQQPSRQHTCLSSGTTSFTDGKAAASGSEQHGNGTQDVNDPCLVPLHSMRAVEGSFTSWGPREVLTAEKGVGVASGKRLGMWRRLSRECAHTFQEFRCDALLQK